MNRPAPFLLGLLLTVSLVSGSCSDDGEAAPGDTDSCDTLQAPLLGCPPRGAQPPAPFTTADACARLASCGGIAQHNVRSDGRHDNDITACVARLQTYTAERLDFTLRCVQAATCTDLILGLRSPCVLYGSQP